MKALRRSARQLTIARPPAPAPTRPRPLGPVATLLLQEAWRLRLKLSDFRDLEDPNDPDGPLVDRHHDVVPKCDIPPGVEGQARAEYYRQLGVQSHSYKTKIVDNRRVTAGGFGVFPISTAIDRKILRMKADGVPYDEIRATLRIGHYRYRRVLRQAHERMQRETKMGNKDEKNAARARQAIESVIGPTDGIQSPAPGTTQVGHVDIRPDMVPPPAPTTALATRALTDPIGLAREYASAAAEILAGGRLLVPQSKTNAIRLLRLSIEMLVG